jgi:transmembrane sensor
MTNLVEFPEQHGVHKQACLWIARVDAGIAASDREALERWLAESPEHGNALMELGRLWDDMDVLAELADLFPLGKHPSHPAEHGLRRYRPALALGAVVCVALLGWGSMILLESPEVESTPRVLDRHTYETEIGGQSSVRLSDSTLVMLNTNSRVDVAYTAVGREVILRRGEAHFDVMPDASRPFKVYAGERIVQAVGTAFNVRLGANQDVKVTVTEGSVHVMLAPGFVQTASMPAGPILPSLEPVVAAGELAVMDDAFSEVHKLAAADMEAELAWQRGMLIFQGDPLDVVLEEVSRYTTVEFQLSDRELGEIKVGGYFRAGDIDGLLIALEGNFGIRADVTGSLILLAAE